MIKKILFCLLLFFLADKIFPQNNLTDSEAAAAEIKALRDGALIVRLKTNDKSIEAYRKAGKKDLADKIVQERVNQNKEIMDAFRYNFDFCKVYFIYAKNSDTLLKGSGGIFLNDTLAIEPSIKLKEKYFLIAEYGSVTDYTMADENRYSSVNRTQASATTASTSAIFISDTTLAQLRKPFPFYVNVYLNHYIKAVDELNKSLYRFYYHLLDKEERQKLKKKPGFDLSNHKP